MKIVGISMIRNDADIVEPFVRHTLRVFDHLFVIVHSPHDGTGEILKALQGEGLQMTLVHYDEPAFLQGEGLTWRPAVPRSRNGDWRRIGAAATKT